MFSKSKLQNAYCREENMSPTRENANGLGVYVRLSNFFNQKTD